jgi:endogenous inhibitor of DNA gyrase (YacG/DUF329 family)
VPKVVSQCEACGKSIEAWPSQRRRFCSRSCRGIVQGQEQWEGRRHKPTKPRRGFEAPCASCGTTIYRAPRFAASGPLYCSHSCQYAGMAKGRLTKACVVCGQSFTVSPSKAAVRYCSNACKGTAATKRPGDRLHSGKRVRFNQDGYVLVWEPNHPNTTQKGWQYEHRLVAEQMLGRYLASSEHVHHVNGVKDDNRPENLEVMDGNEHAILSGREYRDDLQRKMARLAEYERRFGPLEPEA